MAQGIVKACAQQAGLATAEMHRDVRIRDNGTTRYIFNYGPETVGVSDLLQGALQGAEPMFGEAILGPRGVVAFRRA